MCQPMSDFEQLITPAAGRGSCLALHFLAAYRHPSNSDRSHLLSAAGSKLREDSPFNEPRFCSNNLPPAHSRCAHPFAENSKKGSRLDFPRFGFPNLHAWAVFSFSFDDRSHWTCDRMESLQPSSHGPIGGGRKHYSSPRAEVLAVALTYRRTTSVILLGLGQSVPQNRFRHVDNLRHEDAPN